VVEVEEEKGIRKIKTKIQQSNDPLLKQVPEEYFNENFRMNKSVFLVNSND
jgi:hypothetical protein